MKLSTDIDHYESTTTFLSQRDPDFNMTIADAVLRVHAMWKPFKWYAHL